jgi:hypothetical protein
LLFPSPPIEYVAWQDGIGVALFSGMNKSRLNTTIVSILFCFGPVPLLAEHATLAIQVPAPAKEAPAPNLEKEFNDLEVNFKTAGIPTTQEMHPVAFRGLLSKCIEKDTDEKGKVTFERKAGYFSFSNGKNYPWNGGAPDVRGYLDEPDKAHELQQAVSNAPWSAPVPADFAVDIIHGKNKDLEEAGYGLSYNQNYSFGGKEFSHFFSAKKDKQGKYLLHFHVFDPGTDKKPELVLRTMFCTTHEGMADLKTEVEIYSAEKSKLAKLRPNFGPNEKIQLWKSGLYYELYQQAGHKSDDKKIDEIVQKILKEFSARPEFPRPLPQGLPAEMRKFAQALRVSQEQIDKKSPASSTAILRSASLVFQTVWNHVALWSSSHDVSPPLDLRDDQTQATRARYLVGFGRIEEFRRQLEQEKTKQTVEPKVLENLVVLVNNAEELLRAELFMEGSLFPKKFDPREMAHLSQ